METKPTRRAGSCVLTVTKTGEKRPEPEHIPYQVVDAPNAAKMACYTVGEGDVTVVNFASTTAGIFKIINQPRPLIAYTPSIAINTPNGYIARVA